MFQNCSAISHISCVNNCVSVFFEYQTDNGSGSCSLSVDESEFVINLDLESKLTLTKTLSNDLNRSFEPFLTSLASYSGMRSVQYSLACLPPWPSKIANRPIYLFPAKPSLT